MKEKVPGKFKGMECMPCIHGVYATAYVTYVCG
jgi:hypothetical protein